ncbi:MAG TPA: hypothetical protein VKE74_15535 [Gemmataceae bacterium]|nr:hypothetical protein [Gemmataceae bacterium]
MPELTPDPVFDRLARFTPDDSALDAAAILFRAGKASARTPRRWKLAVTGLLSTNIAVVGLLIFGKRTSEPTPAPEPVAVPLIVPVPVEVSSPAPSPGPSGSPSLWSVGALMGTTDPDQLPKPEPVINLAPADTPLTPLAARRGMID